VKTVRAAPTRILVVDASEDVRVLMITVLRESGYEAVGAGSGSEALSFLRRAGFDLVILDLVMPDISGHDLIPLVRESAQGVDLLVVSGYAGCLEQSRLAELGVTRVLSKPFKTQRLLEAVEALTGRAEARRDLEPRSAGYSLSSPRASL
jgi:DNA-binding response OmpR family regulator